MHHLIHTSDTWGGQAAIGFGIGAFCGTSGDNHTHQHYAHQLTLSLDPDRMVHLQAAKHQYQAAALFIPANVPHQLDSGHYLSLYIDPCHSLASYLQQAHTENLICTLSNHIEQQLRLSFASETGLAAALTHFLHAFNTKNRAELSCKVQSVLHLLYQGVLHANIPNRQSLAQVTGLSESRFSHWFREQTGLPLRSYRKWLRLLCGFMHMQQGAVLTEIAYCAEFSDQAHFTRTCIELFGVRPSNLKHIQIMMFSLHQ